MWPSVQDKLQICTPTTSTRQKIPRVGSVGYDADDITIKASVPDFSTVLSLSIEFSILFLVFCGHRPNCFVAVL